MTYAGFVVPIDVMHAEGPHAHLIIEDAKRLLRERAQAAGIDPETLVFRLEPPPSKHGRIETMGTDPITGQPLPEPYRLTATIQENET